MSWELRVGSWELTAYYVGENHKNHQNFICLYHIILLEKIKLLQLRYIYRNIILSYKRTYQLISKKKYRFLTFYYNNLKKNI